MTRPRKELISLADTPYYHITSRCVRRAFLCGVDHYSGQNYEHRRQWIVDRSRLLSSLFAIDICAYAIMSNHYHLVLKACPHQLDECSDDDIIDRLSHRYTVFALVVFSIVVSTKQYVGEPIVCWCPAEFTGAYDVTTSMKTI